MADADSLERSAISLGATQLWRHTALLCDTSSLPIPAIIKQLLGDPLSNGTRFLVKLLCCQLYVLIRIYIIIA
jgi:hypothetical protein